MEVLLVLVCVLAPVDWSKLENATSAAAAVARAGAATSAGASRLDVLDERVGGRSLWRKAEELHGLRLADIGEGNGRHFVVVKAKRLDR